MVDWKKKTESKIVSQATLVEILSEWEELVKQGSLLRKKVQLKHSPGPALSNLYSDCGKSKKWYMIYRSKLVTGSGVIPETFFLHNPNLSAYIYYSEHSVENNICYFNLPENACLCAKPYSPVLYARTKRNIQEAEEELRANDWVFF